MTRVLATATPCTDTAVAFLTPTRTIRLAHSPNLFHPAPWRQLLMGQQFERRGSSLASPAATCGAAPSRLSRGSREAGARKENACGVRTRPCHKYTASRYCYGCKWPCTRTQGQTLLCQMVSTPKRECYQYSDLAAQYVFRGYFSLKFEILDWDEEC